MNEYLTPAEVAAHLRVSVRTVRRWIDAGDLPALRVGAVVRVGRQALAEWERRHEIKSPDGEQTACGTRAPVAAHRAPLSLGSLPAGYAAVFPELWQTDSASPADARGRSATTNKKRA